MKNYNQQKNAGNFQDIQVTVIMSSYNQEKTIRQAIESVLMQRVNFKYKLIITDDYSQKDNTVNIISEYVEKHPEIIEALYNRQNGRYLANILRAKSLTKTPYFCLLDADDYWTDSDFLQRAHDFLEQHRDFVIYSENINCLYDDGTVKPFIDKNRSSGSFDLNDYFNDKIPITQTTGTFFRNVIFINGVPQIMTDAVGTASERSFEGDFDRYIMHLKYGKSYYNNRICGVYRIFADGIWSKLNNIQQKLIQAQCWYDYDRYFECVYKDFFYSKLYFTLLEILETVKTFTINGKNIGLENKEILQFFRLLDIVASEYGRFKIKHKKSLKEKLKKAVKKFFRIIP